MTPNAPRKPGGPGAAASVPPAAAALWHAREATAVLEALDTAAKGLTAEEAARRLAIHGPNRLRPPERKGPWARFFAQFHNVLIYVLLAAAVGTALLSHWIDTWVILGVVVINALIGFIQEGKTEKALEAITKMLSLEATVRRDGRRHVVAAEELVPGDVVILHSGDKVPADLRLIEVHELSIDEAMLTGESVPTGKRVDADAEEASLGDRHSLAFSGTLVTSGSGAGVVVATGDATEIGKISEMVSQTEVLTTPLIRQFDRFGQVLAFIILVFAALTFLLGVYVTGGRPEEMFLAAVALAVAAIPEGLPAIMTIVLAIGVRRMANRNAIIRRLPAVDTLGALTVICSDKTGTLTRNEMTVTGLVVAGEELEVMGVGYAPVGEVRRGEGAPEGAVAEAMRRCVRAGLLCNEADLREHAGAWQPEGDPMEGALITLAMKAGLDVEEERVARPVVDTIPFESRNRFMATMHDEHGEEAAAGAGGGGPGRRVVFVKGSPEAVIAMSDHEAGEGEGGGDDAARAIDRQAWTRRAEAMAAQGRRVLAVATKHAPAGCDRLDFDEVQRGLTLLGLFGIIDPPRAEAIAAIDTCHAAGIRVVMITGDHVLTARAIGGELGLRDADRALTGAEVDGLDDAALTEAVKTTNVFARVSPEHKLRLVTAIQANGEVAAMTGDGVNDAPALKRADVGIAMGVKGTEVSKEAAEMVLTDDNFASIAHAVEEGRTVYDNLRKAILFILPTNGGEGFTIFAAILLGRTLPLTPVQVLWINMITAVTLALALAFEAPESDVTKRPPRSPKANLLDGYFLWRIAFVSGLMCAGTFGMFLLMRAHGAEVPLARTVAVNTMVLFEAFYLLNTRFITAPVLSVRGLFGSMPVLVAIGLVLAFQVLFTYAPFMQRLFGTEGMSAGEWLMAAAAASSVLFLVELEKWVVRTRGLVS